MPMAALSPFGRKPKIKETSSWCKPFYYTDQEITDAIGAHQHQGRKVCKHCWTDAADIPESFVEWDRPGRELHGVYQFQDMRTGKVSPGAMTRHIEKDHEEMLPKEVRDKLLKDKLQSDSEGEYDAGRVSRRVGGALDPQVVRDGQPK